jgi:hypothetical protein
MFHAQVPPPETPPAIHASPGAPPASVPIRSKENLVIVPVSVAGSEPFQLILDTGMPTPGVLLFDSARVGQLGLDFAGSPAIAGAGGKGEKVPAKMAKAPAIRVGELAIPDVRVISLASPEQISEVAEGVIGLELFGKFAVQIDRDASRLRLFGQDAFTPPVGSSIVPLQIRGGSPFLSVRVAVGEPELLPAELAVDLGASHALWLNPGREARFAAPGNAIRTRIGHGMSGPVEGAVGRVRRLELGSFEFADLVAAFPGPSHQNPGGRDFKDGFLGGAVLKRFRVTFDYARERMVLEPGKSLREPFEYDMTGLVLEPASNGRRLVSEVLASSPAAEAGVKAGDVLLAIDGEVPGAMDPEAIEHKFRAAGTELRLVFERDGARFEKTLRLRRLV